MIERTSDDFLQVEHGSLYTALYRLEDRGWISSGWGITENNRKAIPHRESDVVPIDAGVQPTGAENAFL